MSTARTKFFKSFFKRNMSLEGERRDLINHILDTKQRSMVYPLNLGHLKLNIRFLSLPACNTHFVLLYFIFSIVTLLDKAHGNQNLRGEGQNEFCPIIF